MASIELAPEVAEDIDRILDHLTEHEVADLEVRTLEIIQAISVLEHNPMIGRPESNGKRELIIGHGSHGYVALYRYVSEVDTVFVLALKSQRELGYARE